MNTFSLILSFIFGTIIGSFLNVVSLRFNTGVNLRGRSKCMSCGTALNWAELIPVLSFLFQKGSCRKCKSKISWQYPLVEFLAGAVFVLIFLSFPPTSMETGIITAIHILAACTLLVITVYDIKHKIIPDQFVYSFIILSIVYLFFSSGTGFQVPTITAWLSGPIIALPFALLWLFSKGAWMGLGDAKLMLGIGWFLGLAGAINATILAFWIAAVASVAWLLVIHGSFKPKTEVPFGPYLIVGMYLVLIFGAQALDVDLLWNIIRSYTG